MAKRRNPDRKIGSGYGDGSKPTQYTKGKSGNLKGRPRKPHARSIDLNKLLMEKVSLTRDGKTIKVPFPVAHFPRYHYTPLRGGRTQSHAASNRVSAVGKWILKIGDQRLAREIARWWPNIREIELQRPRYVSLIARNVARIHVSGKHPRETRLAG